MPPTAYLFNSGSSVWNSVVMFFEEGNWKLIFFDLRIDWIVKKDDRDSDPIAEYVHFDFVIMSKNFHVYNMKTINSNISH